MLTIATNNSILLVGGSTALGAAGRMSVENFSGQTLLVTDSGNGGDGTGQLVYELSDGAAAFLRNLDLRGLSGNGAYVSWISAEKGWVYGSAQDDILTATGNGRVSLFGGLGNDQLYSGAFANVLDGGRGNDSVDSGAGDDTIKAGAGNDVLEGGSGHDSILFVGNRADYDISFSVGKFTVAHLRGSHADGNDLISGVETFVFADQTVEMTTPTSLLVSNVGRTLTVGGTTLPDTTGRMSVVNIYGQYLVVNDSGNFGDGMGSVVYELLDGEGTTLRNIDLRGLIGNGAYVSWNISGTGHVFGSAQDDILTAVGTGDVSVFGGRGEDQLFSGTFANYLDGGRGDDHVDAGAGNDTIKASAGNDVFEGGAGHDTLVFAGSRSEYDISFVDGKYTVTHVGGSHADGVDRVSNVEDFVFLDQTVEISMPTDLSLDFSANRLTVAGTTSPAGTGRMSVELFGDGSLVVTDSGVTGDGTGGMIYEAGPGMWSVLDVLDLRALFGTGAYVTWGTDHKGRVLGSVQSDILTASGTGSISLYGRSGDDQLFSGMSANYLDGGRGNDTVYAGAGDATIKGGAGDDLIEGGAGQDTAIFVGARADYDVSLVGGQYSLTHARGSHADGSDLISNIETFAFADQTVSVLDLI